MNLIKIFSIESDQDELKENEPNEHTSKSDRHY